MQPCMIYTISFMHGAQVTAMETFRGQQDVAQALAMAMVGKGSADRVEIRNIHGHLVFRYPCTAPRRLRRRFPRSEATNN